MNKFALFLAALGLLATPVAGLAKDVHVRGYYRSDGTYVRPHVRPAPDGMRWNNYGPSRRDSELLNPRSRDNDHDGIPNYTDRNDDNDASRDDSDSSQYGR